MVTTPTGYYGRRDVTGRASNSVPCAVSPPMLQEYHTIGSVALAHLISRVLEKAGAKSDLTTFGKARSQGAPTLVCFQKRGL